MHPGIHIAKEAKRGCGFRVPGGLYMVSDGPSLTCGRLPIPLTVCGTCGHGWKPSRGWTWVDADALLSDAPACTNAGRKCKTCPFGVMEQAGLGKAGLLWVGESFYATPGHFNREADRLGISRRVHAIPREFVLGETYVLLAHRKAIMQPVRMGRELSFTPGIFRIFKPKRLEIIVTGKEDHRVIDGYIKRGLTPVLVKRVEAPAKQEALLNVSP
jgi:hypothetical protein